MGRLCAKAALSAAGQMHRAPTCFQPPMLAWLHGHTSAPVGTAPRGGPRFPMAKPAFSVTPLSLSLSAVSCVSAQRPRHQSRGPIRPMDSVMRLGVVAPRWPDATQPREALAWGVAAAILAVSAGCARRRSRGAQGFSDSRRQFRGPGQRARRPPSLGRAHAGEAIYINSAGLASKSPATRGAQPMSPRQSIGLLGPSRSGAPSPHFPDISGARGPRPRRVVPCAQRIVRGPRAVSLFWGGRMGLYGHIATLQREGLDASERANSRKNALSRSLFLSICLHACLQCVSPCSSKLS